MQRQLMWVIWQLFGCILLKIFVTAASQSCHKDDKFFEVHLGVSIFIQVLEDFINSILVLPRLQKKKSRLRWEDAQLQCSNFSKQGLWLDSGHLERSCVFPLSAQQQWVPKACAPGFNTPESCSCTLSQRGMFATFKQHLSPLKLCSTKPWGHYPDKWNAMSSPSIPLERLSCSSGSLQFCKKMLSWGKCQI